MKYQTPTALAALITLVAAEVPQEHSHEKYLVAVNQLLAQDNPFNIQDAVFGLLGNAAAAAGAGDVKNLDCLHQVTADSAFSAAKAAGDVDGQASALVFRALERNTGSVGLKSVLCDEAATNPEIAALSQHQDPASDGAAEENKAITLELARQLALIGADPLLALESGTFEPGDVNDATGAGNTCDDLDDPEGCIFTKGLLVEDATPEEIEAAVSEVTGGAGGNTGNAGNGTASNSTGVASQFRFRARRSARSVKLTGISDKLRRGPGNAGNSGVAAGTNDNSSSNDGNLSDNSDENVNDQNASSGASNRPFEVNGATFQNAGAALQRSCAVQHNACANAANSGSADISVADCDAQEDDCLAAASLRKLRRSSGFNTGAGRMRIATRAVKSRQAGDLDFGQCQDPSIQFVEGLDGRKEASFGPAGDFNHGSALNINIVSSFICGQLQSRCKANEAAVSACEQGQADAQGLDGADAADAFNSALGV
ncbi:hypothetical protein CCHL11_06869 [Colletotrichum chlorophyti]|uniref:Uncharacterized protein n=1 Tax=Colletotrichum chlorophyti TaxID=708187 RepID=A0A1Q8S9J3_9PEZI|nr:hypothetical protein CCHL11_06869 [Colletotrichum chlorophyti]